VFEVLGKLYKNELPGWANRMREVIPSYGKSIADDPELCHTIRRDTASVLHLAVSP
jgi:malate dehydrogenase (quinone)